ncbi:PAS domain-containing protein (plasmid) [Skermanella mucosa]|uniref:ATP-binding response regulator n=1 Tax=Skermanella mucosa TaxID=1789672 RepID=UPI00192A8059|nr:hybrid sensor histidine kinase/response regulator [Skermanella mucosa]UEM25347.1 PAS domain-containing protein [Skermanella mucosa]
MIDHDVEHALAIAEDAREEAAQLSIELDRVKTLLVAKTLELEHANRKLEQQAMLLDSLSQQVEDNAREAHAAGIVMEEELQILIEELTASNDELVRANQDLEHRVADRTLEIQESERLLSMAQRYAGAGTWDWRIDTGDLTWSDSFLDLCGFDPHTTIPSRERWLESIHPEDRAESDRILQEVLTSGSGDFFLQYRITHPHKGIRWLEGRGQILRDGQARPVRITGLNLDVTDLKLAEEALCRARDEAEEASRAKSRFLASVSHDLRQPVTSANLFLDLLMRRQLGPGERELVEPLANSLENLTGMLNGLLEVARLDAGIVRAEPRVFDLDDLLQRLHGEFQGPARTAGLRLHMPPVNLAVRSDPLLVELILRNLVSNAIKYTLEGGVTVYSRVRDGQVVLEVGDSGQGIAPEELGRIFDDYYQIDDKAHDHSRGFGIGLATARRVSQLLGTRIDVTSEVGRGSVFSLCLPFAGDESAPAAAVRGVACDILAGSSALVIDDEPLVLQAMALMLASWGLGVHAVRTLDQMEILLSGLDAPPTLVIADYTLGHGQRGTEAVAIARRHGTRAAILLTGDTSPDRLAEAEKSGCHLVHKPVLGDKLKALVKDICSAA